MSIELKKGDYVFIGESTDSEIAAIINKFAAAGAEEGVIDTTSIKSDLQYMTWCSDNILRLSKTILPSGWNREMNVYAILNSERRNEMGVELKQWDAVYVANLSDDQYCKVVRAFLDAGAQSTRFVYADRTLNQYLKWYDTNVIRLGDVNRGYWRFLTYGDIFPEWNGEGLPPVGTKCECSVVDFPFCECRVKAYYENKVWLRYLYDNGKDMIELIDHCKFRTIKTEEERAVEEMVSYGDPAAALGDKDDFVKFAKELYRAGYRKV